MARIENRDPGPRGFYVDRTEYLIPASQEVGGRVVNGALEIDDDVLRKAGEDPMIVALFTTGHLVVIEPPRVARQQPEDPPPPPPPPPPGPVADSTPEVPAVAPAVVDAAKTDDPASGTKDDKPATKKGSATK